MDPATPHQEPSSGKRPFVPHGVDAGSWLGFEQRIQERRFRALLETAREALAAGDDDTAQDVLAEARMLRPSAAELDAFAPPPMPFPVDKQRHRAGGAVALLAVGVGLLLAVDTLRDPAVTTPVPSVPVVAPTTEPAIVVATTGARDEVRPAALDDAPAEPAAPIRTHYGAPMPPAAIEKAAIVKLPAPVTRERQPVAPRTSPPARTAAIPPVAVERAAPIAAAVPARPVALAVEPVSTSTIATLPSAAPAPGPVEETRVTATLQRYARAYTDLDAQAARSVWPSVNERALSNAFSGLASQSLDFQNCEVVVHQVEADAVCRGTTSYVTRVGSSSPRVEPRVWHFELSRHGDDWLIDTAVARR